MSQIFDFDFWRLVAVNDTEKNYLPLINIFTFNILTAANLSCI